MRVLSVSSDVSYLVKESRELQTKDLEIKFLIKMYTWNEVIYTNN